jgi:methionyl-tRNA formyltransferase
VRLAFLGTPADAVPALEALHRAGHDIALVVTQPDRKRGRGGELVPSPVRVAADRLGLQVLTPVKAREVVDDVKSAAPELGVVVAFGQLLPGALLDAVPGGFVNLHFSLLPRWRGAAPVERALLAGDRETGVCLMGLEAGLDTGPVYACVETEIRPDDTGGSLHARLVELGTQLLVDELPKVPSTTPAPQVGEPTYAEKLTVDEFELDLTRPAADLERLVRTGNPRPGAWLTVDGKRLKVLAAHVDGGLVPEVVQPEGKRPMDYASWRAGHRGPDPFAKR